MVAYLNEYSSEVRKMLSLEWNDEMSEDTIEAL